MLIDPINFKLQVFCRGFRSPRDPTAGQALYLFKIESKLKATALIRQPAPLYAGGADSPAE